MIRKLQKADLNDVANLWLDTNLKAHNFISAEYWNTNFEFVKEMLPQAEVYVYENDKKIQAGYTQTVTIKYYSRYSSNKIMKYVAFDRIILNYSAYSHYTNVGAYKDYGGIKIELPQN